VTPRLRLKRVKTPFRLVLRKVCYRMHIGRVLKVEHWDRNKRKPKR